MDAYDRRVAESNLQLIRDGRHEDLALVECQRVRDGATVAMVCAVAYDGENFNITPLAEMCAGDPCEEYRPPDPDGGFVKGGD